MNPPIQAEKAEELILHYIKLRYQLLSGEIPKIYLPLQEKARELGFGLRAAYKLIQYARRIGMVEGKKYLRVY